MEIIRPNEIRVKRFREIKEGLRSCRDLVLVGIDVWKDRHAAQVRLSHVRVLERRMAVQNTREGFESFWEKISGWREKTGALGIVCAVEPTGNYHRTGGEWMRNVSWPRFLWAANPPPALTGRVPFIRPQGTPSGSR